MPDDEHQDDAGEALVSLRERKEISSEAMVGGWREEVAESQG